MPLALIALAVATFAIGTSEFVIVGLIPGIAADLGVSIPTAGLLVSLYAFAIALGTPVFSGLTANVPRRSLVLGLMLVFALTNLTAALSPNYATLLASRIVMAVAHGVFFGVGAAVASSLVGKSKTGGALAVMMGGLTVAMVIGVPLGSWLGQSSNWRAPFFVVAAMSSIAVLGLWALLPRQLAAAKSAGFMNQMALLADRRLSSMYFLTAVAFGGTFVVFTFLAPLLMQVTGVAESTVNLALVLFGGASVVGNFVGGRAVDALGPQKAMRLLLTGLLLSLGLLSVVLHVKLMVMGAVTLWGVFAFAIPPVMQTGVVAVAEKVAPTAVATASGMNIAAFNLGISGGSFIGGRLVDSGGLPATPYAAMAMTLIALFATAVVFRGDPRGGAAAFDG
jgi:predicted MFS family arabinose efflux permease